MLDTIKDVSFRDILLMHRKSYGNYYVDSYIPHYPIFCLYAKIVSCLPRQFFVVIPSLIMYLIPIKFCFADYTNKKNVGVGKWVYCISYMSYLLAIDYLSISGIRNITAAMLFCLILYEEMIEEKNKIVCFAGYISLILIHSFGAMLLMIRMILLFSNKFTKIVLMIATVAGYSLLISDSPLIYKLFGGTGFLSHALGRLVTMSNYYVTTVSIRRYYMLAVYLMVLILSILADKYIIIKFPDGERKRYRKLYNYLVFAILFSIGAFRQYDTFMRGGFIIFPVAGILSKKCMTYIGNNKFGRITYKNAAEGLVYPVYYIGSIVVPIFVFYFVARVGYFYMDTWFIK